METKSINRIVGLAILTFILLSFTTSTKLEANEYKFSRSSPHIELFLNVKNSGLHLVIKSDQSLLIREYRLINIDKPTFKMEYIVQWCEGATTEDFYHEIPEYVRNSTVQEETSHTGTHPFFRLRYFGDYMVDSTYNEIALINSHFEQTLIFSLLNKVGRSACAPYSSELSYMISKIIRELERHE